MTEDERKQEVLQKATELVERSRRSQEPLQGETPCSQQFSKFMYCDGTHHRYRDSTHEEHTTNGRFEFCPIYTEAAKWAGALRIYGGHTLDSFDVSKNPEMHRVALWWVQNSSVPLIMMGKAGTGKTKLALGMWAHMTRQRRFQGPWKTFISAPELAELSTLAARGDDEDATRQLSWFTGKSPLQMSDQETMERLTKPQPNPVVVLDDLGSERMSADGTSRGPMAEVVEKIVCRRSDSLIITSNYGIEALGRIYGNRVISRLSSAMGVVSSGKDQRVGESPDLPGEKAVSHV